MPTHGRGHLSPVASAYCFMPDHVHVLVEAGTNESNGLRFISRAKQFSGFFYAKTFGHRLWQRYGFEHILRHDEVTLRVARYIFENPVRAQLVTRVEDYKFCGSCTYELTHILEAVAQAPHRRR
jgi:putative transposase